SVGATNGARLGGYLFNDIGDYITQPQRELAATTTALVPIGSEIAIYDPSGNQVYNQAGGMIPGNLPMTADRRIDTASMAKTITAAATIAALEDAQARGEGYTVDSSIAHFLPSSWALGADVAKVTIRDLLQHTSGLRPYCDADPASNLKSCNR